MRREIVRLQRELNAVSAQDDFARWAKLRRQHDKAVADHDKLSAFQCPVQICRLLIAFLCADNSLSSTRSTFDSRLTLARQIGISGLRLFLQSWYMKSPLFWIPKGWLPIYVEWLLAFPKAPTGSVSIQVWSAACGSVITMMGEAIGAAVVLVLRMVKGDAGAGAKKAPMPQPQKVGQPQKVPT